MTEELKITKLKLSNNQIYSFFDKDAMHYDEQSGKILVGDAFIDNVLINNAGLFIIEINDVDVNEYTTILVQNSTTGEIARRDKNKLLEDIGGYSAKVESTKLSLKLGK